ncbi:hypothetical protein H072_3326 [Dactylellina haptotyla CBS 200.50]|uniref:HCNGP-like protein n=1 Tax=Dactylellina haptotyla (strain CBS 200.50) TaxID=1284197 RepID=S8ANN2_DACHA|nr:hypothetical protein H072_3326 [Dactylellina haptotyla CBS 200.50]
MIGLVEYDSDEDEVQEEVEQPPAVATRDKLESAPVDTTPPVTIIKQDPAGDAIASVAEPTSTVLPVPSPPPLQGPQGPPGDGADTFGPMRPPVEISYPPSEDAASEQAELTSPPLSPYSQRRALLRSYTIPDLTAEFVIPDSPLVSPPAATAKQFATFLDLKKKNVHFNQKLSQTTALRNPNLLENLMQHVGMDSTGQYASNWNKLMWNPDPKGLGAGIEKAKGENAVQALARLQKEGFEERLAERKTVEFVGSSSGASEKAEKGKAQVPMSAAERIMSGLDRDRKPSPSIHKRDGQSSGSRRDDDRDRDRNRNRDDGRRDRYRDDSDRNKRHRSRSRERSRDRQRYRERDYGRR